MGRFPQPFDGRGSLKWIQKLVNDAPKLFSELVIKSLGSPPRAPIEWRSPLDDDQYAEYRDEDFLNRVGIDIPELPLSSFWPARGPQWDALGVSKENGVILVEAKANVPEFVSPPTKAKDAKSLKLIDESLNETREYLGGTAPADWKGTFYQYTNRLAHLYYLREKLGKEAFLVWVYFMNDPDTGGPTCRKEWDAAIHVAHEVLGISKRHKLSPYITDIFIDVELLS